MQHILPKGFQRIRYSGLQATASFKQRYEIIAKAVGDLVDAMISYVNRLKYCDFFRGSQVEIHLFVHFVVMIWN